MRAHTQDGHSPLDILTEMAVEGTSTLVEAQRTLLHLAQQENDIVLNGFKERIGSFLPGVVMTDLVQRSLGTVAGAEAREGLASHLEKRKPSFPKDCPI